MITTHIILVLGFAAIAGALVLGFHMLASAIEADTKARTQAMDSQWNELSRIGSALPQLWSPLMGINNRLWGKTDQDDYH